MYSQSVCVYGVYICRVYKYEYVNLFAERVLVCSCLCVCLQSVCVCVCAPVLVERVYVFL